jgi:glycosyltransferase involved in cell wall biosynthesis
MLPRILFDATSIPANRGGVSRVIESVLPYLSQYPEFEIHVVVKKIHFDEFSRITGITVHCAPDFTTNTLLRLLWEQTGLVKLTRKLSCSVLFSPHYTFPLFSRTTNVVMIHDLTFITIPKVHKPLKRFFFSWWLKRLARSTHSVISPSKATAQEFIRECHVANARVHVAHLGVNTKVFYPPTREEISSFRDVYDVSEKHWIAFLGTLEPRKNIPALIEAYSLLPEKSVESCPLLIAGGPGWDKNVLPALDKARKKGKDVRLLGYMETKELHSFLGGAQVVAYPSLGEGFGLPVLEAFACGSPVLTTQNLSLSEVGGECASYTQTDPLSIARSLEKVLQHNISNSERSSYIAWSHDFSWDKTSHVIAQTLISALKGASDE